MSNEKRFLRKLKKILSVSKRVKMDQMRDALGLDETDFNEKIFEWATDLWFQIDGNYVIASDDDIEDQFTQVSFRGTEILKMVQNHYRKRKNLRRQGLIVRNEDGDEILQKDQIFNSPSGACVFILGINSKIS